MNGGIKGAKIGKSRPYHIETVHPHQMKNTLKTVKYVNNFGFMGP